MIFFILLLVQNCLANITIIVASKYENTNWLNQLDKNIYDIKIYRPNEPGYKYTTTHDKGFEAGMYLRYIIDYYDNLSDYNLFIHGHKQSWHSRDMLYIIPRIDWNNIKYKSVNIDYYQNKSFQNPEPRYGKMFDAIFNILNETMIPENNGYCCAQFIVHKDLNMRHPKFVYINLDNWLQNYEEGNYFTSRAFEYLWSYIFTGEYSIPRYENGLCSVIKC